MNAQAIPSPSVATGAPDDPFAALGVPSDAPAAVIRAARRRIAKALHPDHGGDGRRMQELNQATVDALAIAATPRAPEPAAPADAPPNGPADTPVPRAGSPVVEDVPSFVVEALPAVTFEALLSVAAQLGVIVDDDPPYVLDTVLHAPFRCWCRLEVLPEAGASSVGLLLAGLDGQNPPDVEVVRDVWIMALNEGPALPAS